MLIFSIIMWIAIGLSLVIADIPIKVGIICFGVWFLVIIVYFIIPEKCTKCGKRGGITIIDRQEIDRYNSTKRVEDVTKNKEGKVIRRSYRTIPITMVKYKVTKKCKHCGSEYVVEEKKEI